nr:NAD(P)/FAD-dependent oxidoreductase [uncultured Cohaesibacter sp.]
MIKAKRQKRNVAIIGAGAAGLMAADHLSLLRPDLTITLYDAMPSPARKILMAGKSGLNITHFEGIDNPELFASRYGAAASWMSPMLRDFGAKEVIDWMAELGQESLKGSSGRIFPTVMKASPLLRSLMQQLDKRGVRLITRHRWQGWDEAGDLRFKDAHGNTVVIDRPNATLLALGGPSWPRLGTDGAFLPALEALGLPVRAYRPANCGFDVDWPGRLHRPLCR